MQSDQIGTNVASTRQGMTKSGYETALQAGLQAIQDPQNADRYFRDGLGMVDPSVRNNVAPLVQHVQEGLRAKLNKYNLNDPAQLAAAKNDAAAYIGGAFVASGGSKEQITPFMRTTALDAQGNPIQMPSTMEQATGGVPRVMPQGGGPAQPAQTPMVTNSSSGEQYPLDISGVSHYMNQGPNGQPLTNVYGRPTINPTFSGSDKMLQDEHDTKELASYSADKGMLGSVQQMQAAADDLTAKGGFTVPGFMGGTRGQINNMLETVQNITGKQFTGDAKLPAANADVATINKWHAALSFQLKNMLESTGARGLGVLMEASSAVPSMENTPLAFKVLTSGLKALANWDIGKYEFKEAYRQDPRTGGTLLGSDLAYNKVSSPLDAAKTELGKIGVVLDGSQIRFKDDDALKNAYNTGLFGKPGTQPAMDAASAMHKTMHPEQYK
jgi:hypothetical protein